MKKSDAPLRTFQNVPVPLRASVEPPHSLEYGDILQVETVTSKLHSYLFLYEKLLRKHVGQSKQILKYKDRMSVSNSKLISYKLMFKGTCSLGIALVAMQYISGVKIN